MARVPGRANRSGALQLQLRKRGIPFTLVKEFPFLERESVADLMGFLSLALEPNNDQAFLRMMKKPPRGLGAPVFFSVFSLKTGHATHHFTSTAWTSNACTLMGLVGWPAGFVGT